MPPLLSPPHHPCSSSSFPVSSLNYKNTPSKPLPPSFSFHTPDILRCRTKFHPFLYQQLREQHHVAFTTDLVEIPGVFHGSTDVVAQELHQRSTTSGSRIRRDVGDPVGCIPGGFGRSFLSELDAEESAHKLHKTMWAKFGQRFNYAGIAFTLRVIFKEPHAALPHLSVPDVRCIDWKSLKQNGIKGVVFDKDNTLTAPYVQSLWPPLVHSLEDCKNVFGGRVALLSNSAGLYQYDPDGAKAKAVEDVLGIPVIRHESKKPAGSAQEVQRFFDCDLSSLVMVGDRYFTDIVYGNKNGLFTIYITPLTPVGEPFIVRQVRKLENAFVLRWLRKGLKPTNHRLVPIKSQFITAPSSW